MASFAEEQKLRAPFRTNCRRWHLCRILYQGTNESGVESAYYITDDPKQSGG